LVWTHFLPRAPWLDWLGWPEAAPGLFHLDLNADPAARENVARRLLDMHRLATGALPRRDLFALNALEEALLWCDAANPRSAQAKLDARVRAATEFLLQNLRETVPLDALARTVGLSVSRLSHLFRQQVGLTPQQFVERERITRAKQLLELTSRTVAAIAGEVGYENPFYFTLRFKRHTGLSPTEWRKARVPIRGG
jgi:AraC family transcriptional regulator of arabinose operon